MQRTTALCSGSGSGSGAAARHTLAALQRPSASRPSCSSSRGVALPAIRGRHHQLEQQQQQQQQFRCRSADAAAAPTTAAAAAAVGAPPDDLTPEQQQQWSACVARLVGLGFAEADADRTVSRAFGWGTQAYWRREKVREPPEAARLEAVVALLLDLGLTDAEVPRVIKAFPEVLGLSLDALTANVAKLQRDWKLEGQVLARAVARQPAVLGYTIDCMGDCAGECNRCWARF